MPTPSHSPRPIDALWQYNMALLAQTMAMVDALQADAAPTFQYAQAVGPHVRHILEHYQALIAYLDSPARSSVDYDARGRDMLVQSQPESTRAKVRWVREQLGALAARPDLVLSTPLSTRLKTGEGGDTELTVPSTLGRELLFLSSHTVHHFALLGHYCKAAGVEMGADFGKAPATVAFERLAA
ncbi:hypothetical protein [Rhodoferax sp. PAMC 29310]|uniref:hypothetical protein n=1 Tax=Rhodoferax sp. PAMC 29310 TaxID=2822760 RepID=UPI001B31E733|nr:hypothetical protein [Rhodoferax sp. PAMC 29310]